MAQVNEFNKYISKNTTIISIAVLSILLKKVNSIVLFFPTRTVGMLC